MASNDANVLVEAEQLLTKMTKIYFIIVYTSTTFFCTVPGIMIFYAYITNNVTERTYLAPFRDM